MVTKAQINHLSTSESKSFYEQMKMGDYCVLLNVCMTDGMRSIDCCVMARETVSS